MSQQLPNQAELVVSWYQNQLAVAQQQVANLTAENIIFTKRIEELTKPVDPNLTGKGSDA